jgi:hypothetical protein
MAELTYKVSWTCGGCRRLNEAQVGKVEAAFFDCARPRPACRYCGSRGKPIPPGGREMPKIDLELLEIWFEDKTLSFMDQDEDLMIADADLDDIKSFLQAEHRPGRRASAMGPVIAVKLSDGLGTDVEQDWMIEWLKAHEKHWRDRTMGYIKKKINRRLRP